MSLYALVENGEVKSTGEIPVNFKNTGGFNLIKNPAKYKAYGFLPYSYVAPKFDELTENLGDYIYTITEDAVVATREVFPIQQKVMDEQKKGHINNVTNILNEILYNTDWVYVADSNLDAEQLKSYTDLRASAVRAKALLESLEYKFLAGLVGSLSLSMQEVSKRLADFSESMLELKTIIDSIGV